MKKALVSIGAGLAMLLGACATDADSTSSSEELIALLYGSESSTASSSSEGGDPQGTDGSSNSGTSENATATSSSAAGSSSDMATGDSSSDAALAGSSSDITTVGSSSNVTTVSSSSTITLPTISSSSAGTVVTSSASTVPTKKAEGLCVVEPNAVEEGGSVKWSFLSTDNSVKGTSYEWTIDDKAATSTTDSSITQSFTEAGAHSAKLIVNKGSSSESDVIHCDKVTVLGPPEVYCDCSPSPETLGELPVEVTWTVSCYINGESSSGPFTYEWKNTSQSNNTTGTKTLTEDDKKAPSVTVTYNGKASSFGCDDPE